MAAPASSLGSCPACAFENLASIRRRRCGLTLRAVGGMDAVHGRTPADRSMRWCALSHRQWRVPLQESFKAYTAPFREAYDSRKGRNERETTPRKR